MHATKVNITFLENEALVEVTYVAEVYFKTDEAAIAFAQSVGIYDEECLAIPEIFEIN